MPIRSNVILQSSLTELYKLEAFIENIAEVYNINQNYYSTILMSLDEAARNAIEHGNKFSRDKKVTIDFIIINGEFIFTVKDEGEGFFAYKNTSPINFDSDKNGRGLYLIQKLSDNISFNDDANEISIHFKVTSINQELALKRASALMNYFTEHRPAVNV